MNVNVEETERAFLDRVEQLHVQRGCTGWLNPNLPRPLSNDFFSINVEKQKNNTVKEL